MAKDKSGYVSVEFHPEWLDYIVPERFNNADLNRIVTFFVFHSPCSELSAMSKSLVEYGWNAPWRKPQYLQRRLKAASTNADLLFSAETIDDMRQALEKAELLEDITANIEVERIAVYNNKKNQFMSVFYHLRDAFAHGRLNMVDIGLAEDKGRQEKKAELIDFLHEQTNEFEEFDDGLVRRLIEQITVHESGTFTVEFKSGTMVEV